MHVIQHQVSSADARYDAALVRDVEVSVRDNDTPGIVVTEVDPTTNTADGTSTVIEGRNNPAAGGAYTGKDDAVDVSLATDPGEGVTVIVVQLLARSSALPDHEHARDDDQAVSKGRERQ